MLQKLENRRNRLFTVCSRIFIGNKFGNNTKYFDQVTFTTNVTRKKVCVDVIACTITSEVINIGQK